ncbi:MAG TPA: efflux transporter periplasmic adaptor subunit, partial [Candidatus Angelobacter sp.]|nr:efflux transporter periplasmic adaptor subunit [Candidatus Angelobacter sp.]
MLATLSVQITKYNLCVRIGLVVALVLPLAGCATKTEAAPPPPPEVQVVPVEQKDVPIYGEWVATLDGYVNADIRPQVTGYLMKQNYREGMLVRKGDVL